MRNRTRSTTNQSKAQLTQATPTVLSHPSTNPFKSNEYLRISTANMLDEAEPHNRCKDIETAQLNTFSTRIISKRHNCISLRRNEDFFGHFLKINIQSKVFQLFDNSYLVYLEIFRLLHYTPPFSKVKINTQHIRERPNDRMVQAFGDVSLLCRDMMFSIDIVPATNYSSSNSIATAAANRLQVPISANKSVTGQAHQRA